MTSKTVSHTRYAEDAIVPDSFGSSGDVNEVVLSYTPTATITLAQNNTLTYYLGRLPPGMRITDMRLISDAMGTGVNAVAGILEDRATAWATQTTTPTVETAFISSSSVATATAALRANTSAGARLAVDETNDSAIGVQLTATDAGGASITTSLRLDLVVRYAMKNAGD
jgi:hypothetical protein